MAVPGDVKSHNTTSKTDFPIACSDQSRGYENHHMSGGKLIVSTLACIFVLALRKTCYF